MNWISRLIGSARRPLSPEQAARLERWRQREPEELGQSHFETRYVVVNTEATGLDLDKDRLIALAAIAIERGELAPARAIYRPLDDDPAAAMVDFLEFAGKSPWVVFNAAFNRTLLEKACEGALGLELEANWIDLQWLLPGLFSALETRQLRLADWMERFGIETFQRHHGLGDAYAIAQLLMIALGRARTEGSTSARTVMEIERARRWSQKVV